MSTLSADGSGFIRPAATKYIQALMPIGNLIMTGRRGHSATSSPNTAMEMGMMAADMVIDRVDRRHASSIIANENTVIKPRAWPTGTTSPGLAFTDVVGAPWANGSDRLAARTK